MLDNTQIYTVPPGHYFYDGRQPRRRFGETCRVFRRGGVGRAEFLFFSTDGSARWWEVWKWPFAVRYRRLFHGIN